MPCLDCVVQSEIPNSPRSKQLRGMFDVAPTQKLRHEWHVSLPIEERDWNIGLVVGPSGSGKSTILHELSEGQLFVAEHGDGCVLDDFPPDAGIKQIVEWLSAVGFSSPPDWQKPYAVLSNGERFRVDLALAIAQPESVLCLDEFTSVVHRSVAKTASAAFAKYIRKSNRKAILASCHDDIIEWLSPDWVLLPHLADFKWQERLRRPSINLEVRRVPVGAWKLFAAHHYLSSEHNRAARCFVAFWEGTPVAWTSSLPVPHRVKGIWREHRTVCLPDYQGVGIGNALSEAIGSVVKAIGFRWRSVTSHPGMVAHRARSQNWRLCSQQDSVGIDGRGLKRQKSRSTGRATCSFEYVGPAWSPKAQAAQIWGDKP